jgi:hypothetical protein
MKIRSAVTFTLTLNLALTAFVAGMAGVASAQDKAAGGEENTQYKAKTVYDFDDDTVEGDLQRPDGELVDSLRKTKQSSLIEIRKDFIPEMLKSLEDI